MPSLFFFPNTSVLFFFVLSPTIFIDLKSFTHNHSLARLDWFPFPKAPLFYLLQFQNVLPYVRALLSKALTSSSLEQSFPSLLVWAAPPAAVVSVGVTPGKTLEHTSLGTCLSWILQKTVRAAWDPLHQEILISFLPSVGEWGKERQSQLALLAYPH